MTTWPATIPTTINAPRPAKAPTVARGSPITDWAPPTDSNLRNIVRPLAAGLAASLALSAMGGWFIYRDYAPRAAARLALEQQQQSHAILIGAPAGPVLTVEPVASGKALFEGTCAACHKADGTGIDGLGKDLTRSWFVASLEDAALRGFVKTGRAANDPLNSTGVPMLPRGGRPDLTDADLDNIVAYLRCLQDPRRMPQLPASALAAAPIAAPTEDEKAKALAAAGGDEELAEYIAHGTKVFAATCAACHGRDGKGLPKLGKDLVSSDFCRTLDDDALLAFIKKGRDPGDPANTTKVGMPPKGGNPALSDDDILDVIAYVRTLQKPSATP